MAIEIRSLVNEEELDAATRISAQAFASPFRHDMAGSLQRAREASKPEWHLGVFEAGEMTSMMCIIPNEMYINGAALSFGTVSPVASSPLHRRKGHAGAMLRRSLAVMRERSQVISGLYTPHPALYRRYGWEIASDWRRYSFNPKDFRPQAQPQQRGRFRWLTQDDWQQLDRVYQVYAADNNGALRRTQGWWKHAVLDVPWRPVEDIVLWEDDAGEPRGYALYQQPVVPGHEPSAINVIELIATTPDAYLNLLTYFARHDIHKEISIFAAPDDPLPQLFGDTERLKLEQHYAVLLRVIDFEAAMAARPAARPEDAYEVTLRIEDVEASWNDGVWRCGVAEGRSWAKRADGAAELTLPARVLGPLFNGCMAPSTAARAGLLAAESEDALSRADRVFAARRVPYFPDQF
jgi:predicted acetyltransferase